jgi:radical SAM-linked protein
MSQGFNPRPRISLPAPLSVGLWGRNEVLDFELQEWVRPREVEQRLSSRLPEGFALNSLRTLPKKPNRRPRQFSYRVPLERGHPIDAGVIEKLLNADEAIVRRKKKKKSKTVNIAPFIQELRLRNGALHMLLEMTDRGTARPEEVLEALGCEPGTDYNLGQIERTRVNLSSSL